MPAGTRVALFFAAIFAASAVNSGFLPLFFADRGLSPEAIGRVLGLAALLRVLAGPGWGNVADRIGQRRPVLCVAGATAALAALAYLPLTGFLGILAVASVQGVAAAALGPLVDSLALALARDRMLEYGPVRSAGSVAYMLASALTGRLLAAAGTALLPWLLTIGYAAAAALAPLLPEAEVPRAAAQPLAGLRLFALSPFRLTVAASALIQGAHAAYYGFAPLFWRAQGYSDTLIGLLLAEGIVAEILLFARGRKLVEQFGPVGLTACAAAASVVRWSITALAPPLPVLAAVQLLHAATFAMQHFSAMLVLSRWVPRERAATAQALHAALGMGAPTGVMMLLCGWLYARGGGLMFLAMAACGGTALLLIGPLARAIRITR
jgi:PPP family 3-phenylpropionic acid transporter